MTHEEILIPCSLKLQMIRVHQNFKILGFSLFLTITQIWAVPGRRCPSDLLGNDPATSQLAAVMHWRIKNAAPFKTPVYRHFLLLPPWAACIPLRNSKTPSRESQHLAPQPLFQVSLVVYALPENRSRGWVGPAGLSPGRLPFIGVRLNLKDREKQMSCKGGVQNKRGGG